MGIFLTKEEKEAQRLTEEHFREKREEKYAKADKENKLRLEKKEMTEKQLLEAILKTNRKTSGWITFIGWVVLISIVCYIIIALGGLLTL